MEITHIKRALSKPERRYFIAEIMEQILSTRQETLAAYFDCKNRKLTDFLALMESVGFEALKKRWPEFEHFTHLQETGILAQEILCALGDLHLKVGHLREESRNDPAVIKKLEYVQQLF